VATTRRVATYTISREGTEQIEWPHGSLETQRWHRRSADGKTDAYVWLAPSLNYVPVKLRVTNTLRGTVEVMLDSIRVDEARQE
jgi:heme exporter protein D